MTGFPPFVVFKFFVASALIYLEPSLCACVAVAEMTVSTE
jgi:hypothetical protein